MFDTPALATRASEKPAVGISSLWYNDGEEELHSCGRDKLTLVLSLLMVIRNQSELGEWGSALVQICTADISSLLVIGSELS